MSTLAGARNVVVRDSTFNDHSTNVHHHIHMIATDDFELLDKKLPRAHRSHYNANSPAQRNGCLENTREAILAELVTWAGDHMSNKIYWLSGMAGTGKTTIAYSFCEILSSERMLAANFFCSRLEAESSNVVHIFPTIAHQLARRFPAVSSALVATIRDDPDVGYKIVQQNFKDLIVQPLRAAAADFEGTSFVVVIDALDECTNQSQVADLLLAIARHASSLPVKFFVTSRPEKDIRKTFKRRGFGNFDNFILHDVEKDVVSSDIELYTRYRLTDIADGRSDLMDDDEWPPESQVKALVTLSGSLFIYAATACSHIAAGIDLRARLTMITDTLSGTTKDGTISLDALYSSILAAAYKNANQMEKEEIQKVLYAVLHALDPLSINSLSHLLRMTTGQIQSALSCLHSLIHVPRNKNLDDPITTFHSSFPDFVNDHSRSGDYHLDPTTSHQLLSLDCLELMEGSFQSKDIVSYLRERNQTDIPQSLSYATTFWISHLASSQEKDDKTPVFYVLSYKFFQARASQWIDCSSIIGQVERTVNDLHKIEKWAESQPLLNDWARDVRRFMTENMDFIRSQSLEGYSAPFLWLPEKSYMKQKYESGRPSPWKLILGQRHTWDACEAILTGHSAPVVSVAYSPDGKHIVSGGRDNIIRLWNAATGEPEAELTGHSSWVTSVAFSPDGAHIASASGDRTICSWNPETGEFESQLKVHPTFVRSVAFSPDGRHGVSGLNENSICIWNTVSAESEVELKGHSDWVESVAFSPNGKYVVSGSHDHAVRVWNSVTGYPEAELKGHSSWVVSVAFSPDGNYIVSGSSDNTIRIWNATTWETEAELKGHSNGVNSVAYSSDGSRIVSASDDSTVCLWNALTGELEATLRGHASWVASAVFSPNGAHVTSTSGDKTVRIWNAMPEESDIILKGHSTYVRSVAFSSNGTYIVSGSDDCKIYIWNIASRSPEAQLIGHSSSVVTVAFSPDNSHVISGSSDNIVCIWNVTTRKAVMELYGHLNYVRAVACSPDGKLVASGSHDNTIRIWDAEKGTLNAVLTGHSAAVTGLAFSSDGGLFVSASDDGTLCIWDLATRQPKKRLRGHQSSVNSVAYSSDGLYIISGSSDSTICIWSIETGKPKLKLKGNSGWVNTVAFSPDGKLVVYASGSKQISICDAKTGEHMAELQGHSEPVTSINFSPNGKYLVSASSDKTIHIWDMLTCETKMQLKGHSNWVSSVAFSPDGSHVVSGCHDHTVRVWDVMTGMCEAEFKDHSGQVYAAAYFPDGQHVISGSDDRMVRKWNIVTGECMIFADNYLLPNGTNVHHRPFGDFYLSPPAPFPLNQLSLDVTGEWINHKKSTKKCWIPPLFRQPSAIAYHTSMICLGYETGEVIALQLNHKG